MTWENDDCFARLISHDFLCPIARGSSTSNSGSRLSSGRLFAHVDGPHPEFVLCPKYGLNTGYLETITKISEIVLSPTL